MKGRPQLSEYSMDVEAHSELLMVREHLRMLETLCYAEVESPDDLVVAKAGMAHCFRGLADAVDRVIQSLVQAVDRGCCCEAKSPS